MFETIIAWLASASLKGSFLILLVAAIHALTRDWMPARWRYAMWLLVAFRLLLPAAPETTFSIFNLLVEKAPVIERFDLAPVSGPARIAMPLHAGPSTGGESGIGLAEGIAIAWLIGMILLGLRLAVSSIRLHRTIESRFDALQASEPGVTRDVALRLFEECRAIAGVSRSARLIETDLVKSPALHGIVRPVLLLPKGMMESFSANELRNIFLHELAHLRRLDVVTNWIVATVQIIHWFNPLVWFAVARMREERELACDELALSWLEQEQRLSYGRTILKLLDRFRPPAPVPAIVGIVNHKNLVKRRLMMITSFRNPSRYAVLFFALVAAVALVSLTDANAGERHHKMMKKLSPAAGATMSRLDTNVTLDVQNASLADLFNAISNQTGVAIKFAPELVNDPVQNARLNLKSAAVPAHLVLMETLTSVGLMCEPGEDGLTVKKADAMHKECLEHHKDAADHVHKECHRKVVVETNGSTTKASKTMKVLDGETATDVDEKVFVRKIVEKEEDVEAGAPGRIHRKLTIRTEDTADQDGTLEFEITLAK